jgi:hypothetical protein
MTEDELNNLLDAVAGICLRCFILSICLLLLWFVFFLVGRDWVYSIHSRWFEIDRYSFDIMCYYLMGITKIVTFLFFLLPFIAIKLILRKKK